MREQIFISYRRDGGDVTAKLICEALKNRGFTVFYDYDSLSGGYFDDRIFEAIDGCNDFILVLPEHSLDRCVNEDDWVRQEIACALNKKKNIIPVMLPGFTFPSVLPADIENVSRVNGVQFVMNYFEGVMNAIEKRLTARPVQKQQTPPPSKETVVGSGQKKQSLIRTVCSFGSCNFDSTSPSDAYYSEVIDRNRYNIVYFSITTAPIQNKFKIRTRITIYDSNNHIVFEDFSNLTWAMSYNQITLSWIIRGKDGSFVRAGNYRAEFQIEDSEAYSYEFTITANQQSAPYSNNNNYNNNYNNNNYNNNNNNNNYNNNNNNSNNVPKESFKVRCCKAFLACPRVLPVYFWFLISGIVFTRVVGESAGGVIISIISILISWIVLMAKTRKYICKNFVLALLITTLGYSYYGFFLFIMSILKIFFAKSWKKVINEQ